MLSTLETTATLPCPRCRSRWSYSRGCTSIRRTSRPGAAPETVVNVGRHGKRLMLQVVEDLLDDQRIFDAGDDLDGAAAALAGLDVDVEHTLQALRLRLMAARRSAGVGSSDACDAPGLLPLPRLAGVIRARCALFGAKTPWKRVRLTRGLGTKATSRAMKSSGSKFCVQMENLDEVLPRCPPPGVRIDLRVVEFNVGP